MAGHYIFVLWFLLSFSFFLTYSEPLEIDFEFTSCALYILAVLLHVTQVVGVSQTLWCGTRNGIKEFSQRAPPIFGRAAITLGIGPHSCVLQIEMIVCDSESFPLALFNCDVWVSFEAASVHTV